MYQAHLHSAGIVGPELANCVSRTEKKFVKETALGFDMPQLSMKQECMQFVGPHETPFFKHMTYLEKTAKPLIQNYAQTVARRRAELEAAVHAKPFGLDGVVWNEVREVVVP